MNAKKENLLARYFQVVESRMFWSARTTEATAKGNPRLFRPKTTGCHVDRARGNAAQSRRRQHNCRLTLHVPAKISRNRTPQHCARQSPSTHGARTTSPVRTFSPIHLVKPSSTVRQVAGNSVFGISRAMNAAQSGHRQYLPATQC